VGVLEALIVDSAAPPLSPDERRATLEAFARTLRREAYVLSERPDLLWQQLYNRLQWEADPMASLLGQQLAVRSGAAAKPWIRTKRAFRESSALLRILGGHANWVMDCAVSPDSSFVVSADGDGLLKVWDPFSGRELRTLNGHTEPVFGCAVSRGCPGVRGI
jgi:WD40 repeat protein